MPKMTQSRLKKIAIILWGIIFSLILIVLSVLFSKSTLNSSVFAPKQYSIKTEKSIVTPSLTTTPSPAVIFLPSATARKSTPMPPVGTPTTARFIPGLQNFMTLPAGVNPLTGLKVNVSSLLERRPIAVKISTFPRGIVRPHQYGLSRADLVFEYYIEDGLTRFIAVFYSNNASRAGPVRSGRYFDEYIMRMYHAVLVFVNADERVEKHMLESDQKPLLFVPRDDNCPPLCRDTSIPGYNNVFVDTAGVGEKITDNSKQQLRPAAFGELFSTLSSQAITQIYTHYSIYSYNYWQYDQNKKEYLRYSDTADADTFTNGEKYAPHIDQLNKTQLRADNVIELVVPHIFHNEFDRADQVIDITLTGSGDAYLFRDGRMIKMRWVRDKIDQAIQFQDNFGYPVPIKPGVTFFQVIDTESTIKQNGTQMDFFFSIPLLEVTPTSTPFGFEPTPTPKKRHK